MYAIFERISERNPLVTAICSRDLVQRYNRLNYKCLKCLPLSQIPTILTPCINSTGFTKLRFWNCIAQSYSARRKRRMRFNANPGVRDSQTSCGTKSKRDAISQIRRISRRGVYPVPSRADAASVLFRRRARRHHSANALIHENLRVSGSFLFTGFG